MRPETLFEINNLINTNSELNKKTREAISLLEQSKSKEEDEIICGAWYLNLEGLVDYDLRQVLEYDEGALHKMPYSVEKQVESYFLKPKNLDLLFDYDIEGLSPISDNLSPLCNLYALANNYKIGMENEKILNRFLKSMGKRINSESYIKLFKEKYFTSDNKGYLKEALDTYHNQNKRDNSGWELGE